MITNYSAEIKIAILQSVSESQRVKWRSSSIVELAKQITNSFMQWNKNSPHAVITLKNHKWPKHIMH